MERNRNIDKQRQRDRLKARQTDAERQRHGERQRESFTCFGHTGKGDEYQRVLFLMLPWIMVPFGVFFLIPVIVYLKRS